MSWFIVYRGNSEELRNKLRADFPGSRSLSLHNSLVIYEGRDETLYYNFEGNDTNFIVSGLGILKEENYNFANSGDWKELIISKKFLQKLNGHFAGCVIQQDLITCFNDPLGLRDIYYLKLGNDVVISTRTDLLSNLLDNKSPSYDYIAGNWLISTPLFYSTPAKEINRLCPGGIIEFQPLKEPLVTNKKFTAHKSDKETVKELLNKLTLFPLSSKNISLGLSGGLDSRILLSILANSKTNNWRVHTFGSGKMKDVATASAIAKKLKIHHTIFNRSHFDIHELLKWIENYLPFTGLTVSISDLLHVNYHKLIDDYGYTIIDGAFGEIGRRQFMNRLLLKASKIIKGKNTDTLIDNMRISKADIFNEDIKIKLEESLKESAQTLWPEMEGVSQKDPFYWLDKLMIRYKLPNSFSYGQHCLDQISTAFMPFVQEDFLEIVLGLPQQLKRNAKLYREIILQQKKELTEFKLVKDHISYPYRLGTLTSHIWRRAKNKVLNYTKVDPAKYFMFEELKEYIYDELNSTGIRTNNFYDYEKIKTACDCYYEGDKNYFSTLDWWLTFNEWYKIHFNT